MVASTRQLAVLALARHVVIEHFDSGAVLLILCNQTLVELDTRQTWILNHLDGQRTVDEVVKDYAVAFASTPEEATEAVHALCEWLLREQYLWLVQGSWEGNAMNAKRYIQNPDVNLREEDEDGGLLYDPDTDRVQLLNSTGLYIWKLCAQGRTASEISAALKAEFDEVPQGEVAADVEEFISQMTDSGFIGALETP